ACSRPAFTSVCQSSLVATVVWSEERTICSVGLARKFAMPNGASEGPVAVTATVLLVEPPMMKPPIITLLPVSTCIRVEMLPRRGGSPADTVKPCSTRSAGLKSASPAWSASMVHVPAARSVATDPATVQTEGVADVSATASPDDDEATRGTDGAASDCGPGFAKEMCWSPLVTVRVNDWVASGATPLLAVSVS